MGRLDLPDKPRDEDRSYEDETPAKPHRKDGAAVECPECKRTFGGMVECPWCHVKLTPLHDADPTALAFYEAINGS